MNIGAQVAAQRAQQKWLKNHADVVAKLDQPLPAIWDTSTPYRCMCSVHGPFYMSLYALSKGRWCTKCGRSRAAKAALEKRESNQMAVLLQKYDFSDMHPDDLKALKDGVKQFSDECRFWCSKHQWYKQRPTNHYTNGEGCPHCVHGNYRSSMELEICALLDAWGITYETNVRSVIKPHEIDIYIKSHSIGIECNGALFHGSLGPQFQGFSHKAPDYHFNKFVHAESVGVHLVQVFDTDWSVNKERITRCLHDMLVPTTKVYARKCIIREVKDCKQFLDDNHIQGWSRFCKLNYGLYYEGELVALMCFGKPRFGKTFDYELHRFAVKSGMSVTGGASRLLKAFRANHYGVLVSYSDNDYFSGNMYERLGFQFNGYTDPRYFWYKNHAVYTREQCMLKHLAKEYPELYSKATGNREDFIMTSLGATKVYRSGNKRWILSL